MSTTETPSLPLLDPPKKRKGKFSRIPKVIERRGRAKGFEKIRDKLLKDWEGMSVLTRNPLAVLKTVIEMDRHAMFAEVQQAKASKYTDEQYEKFQKYLEGEDNGPGEDRLDKDVAKAVDTIDEMIADHAEEIIRKDEKELD